MSKSHRNEGRGGERRWTFNGAEYPTRNEMCAARRTGKLGQRPHRIFGYLLRTTMMPCDPCITTNTTPPTKPPYTQETTLHAIQPAEPPCPYRVHSSVVRHPRHARHGVFGVGDAGRGRCPVILRNTRKSNICSIIWYRGM